jgi:hypothetical protein
MRNPKVLCCTSELRRDRRVQLQTKHELTLEFSAANWRSWWPVRKHNGDLFHMSTCFNQAGGIKKHGHHFPSLTLPPLKKHHPFRPLAEQSPIIYALVLFILVLHPLVLSFVAHLFHHNSLRRHTKEHMDMPEFTGCRWSYAIKHCRPSSASSSTCGISAEQRAAKPQRKASRDKGTCHLGGRRKMNAYWW